MVILFDLIMIKNYRLDLLDRLKNWLNTAILIQNPAHQ